MTELDYLKRIAAGDAEIKSYISENNFADAAKFLLQKQNADWELLSDGYRSLLDIQIKEFDFDAFKIKVQYNPKRLISSSAKVDSESIKKRKCFLCTANLPEEQKGILYRDRFLILCNPFPIFPEHFTISSINHVPQAILNSFPYLLSLAEDLSKYYTVFYNGPECGASAPDHLHFQAGTKSYMPLDDEYLRLKKDFGKVLIDSGNFTAESFRDGLRKYFAFESDNPEMLNNMFRNFYLISSEVLNLQKEPMMNILAYYEKPKWRIIIFLRERHRPDFYFYEGEKKFLWSPASVDLGGICILPREKDFINVSRVIITEGLKEITLSEEKFALIEKRLGNISE